MRDFQKVYRPTQLIARCTSYFVTFQQTNACGPAFPHSSDSFVEELLVLLFQLTICRTDNVPSKNCPI